MDDSMEEWVTPREASEIKKVGLSPHRIRELARFGKIAFVKAGLKKRLVKVIFVRDENKWELIYVVPQAKAVQGSQPIANRKNR